jgi:hypothetical protein
MLSQKKTDSLHLGTKIFPKWLLVSKPLAQIVIKYIPAQKLFSVCTGKLLLTAAVCLCFILRK